MSVLRTCALCGLSYTIAAPADEALHKAHCARARRGMEWGRDEARGATEVASGLRLKSGMQGRIVSVRLDAGGKLGSKVGLHLLSLPFSRPRSLT
jgi:N-acetyltransferase